jgi:hypothetical protein
MRNWCGLVTLGSTSGIATSGTAITGSNWRGGQGKQKRDCGQEIVLFRHGTGDMESEADQVLKALQPEKIGTVATLTLKQRRSDFMRRISQETLTIWMGTMTGRHVRACRK